MQRRLLPAVLDENARPPHFEIPLDHFSVAIFHVDKDVAMRICPRKAADDALKIHNLIGVVFGHERVMRVNRSRAAKQSSQIRRGYSQSKSFH